MFGDSLAAAGTFGASIVKSENLVNKLKNR